VCGDAFAEHICPGTACRSPTRQPKDASRPPVGSTVEAPDESGGNTVSEILLSLLAEALGAALLGLVMTAIRRAMGAART